MKKWISNSELSTLCFELSMLLHAGIGLGDALSLLAEDSQPGRQKWMASLARQVDGGTPLSQAMESSSLFPPYVCGLIQVGERTGRTEEALKALSQYYESRSRTDQRVRGALLYPAVMLALMLVVIGVLFIRVLPIFDDVYASLGSRLTGVAGALVAVGRWLGGCMPVLWGLLALIALFVGLFAVWNGGRERLFSWWRSRRGDRGVARKLNTARLAQALSMGLASGLTLEEALHLSAGLFPDTPALRRRCRDCQDRLDREVGLAAAFQESGLFPAADCRLLELGQRTGSLDRAMEKLAADLSAEGEAALEDAVGRVEPILVLVCSLLMGLILLTVMLPMMNIMAVLG